jgi:hypothetical protein
MSEPKHVAEFIAQTCASCRFFRPGYKDNGMCAWAPNPEPYAFVDTVTRPIYAGTLGCPTWETKPE